jgi:hypothetical protein
MRWLFLFLLAAPSLWAQEPSPITSATFRSNEFTLDWDSTVPGDSALVSVFNVERRSSLTNGDWVAVASDDHTAGFTDMSPPPDQGFYRLVPADFPFAMVGPAAGSDLQGLSFSSPGFADVLFFRSLTPTNTGSNSVVVWVDGAMRATISYAADREGTEFRYGVGGGPPIGGGTFNGDTVLLTTPGFAARPFAEIGAAAARDSLADLVTRFPDSVTVWQNVGGTNTNEATVLYLRASAADTNTGARPGEFGSDVVFLGQPLVSGAGLLPVAGLSDAFPFSPADPQMVNLNATNTSTPIAFVGTRSMTNAGAPIAAAQWVYVGASPGPTNATNPPVARYAYWVEDESFKVNVNTATNGPRGASTNVGPGDLRLDGSWQSSSNAAVQAADAAGVVSARGTNLNLFPTVGSAAAVAGLTDVASAADFRFLTTVNSAGLDLSRGGFRRFNINSVTNGVTNDALKRIALDRLVVAITNTNAAPLFGQRFYRLANNVPGINNTTAVSADHANIYLQKIAANLYDYLDDDDQPTIINNDAAFSLRTGRPAEGIHALGGGLDGSNSVAAMGIEVTPRLQEYAIHARIRRLDPYGFNSMAPPVDPVAQYEIWIDHYLEFWNPGTRDITLTNAFLKIYDQPSFGNGITGPLRGTGRPFEIAVNNITFPAGRVTVLTTAQPENLNTGDSNALILTANASNVISLPTADVDRVFVGQTRDFTNAIFGGFNYLFTVEMRPRSTLQNDYLSAMVLGNDLGILESFVGLPIATFSRPALRLMVDSQIVADTITNLPAGNSYFLRGGSLRGNSPTFSSPSAAEGDPRALNEQIEFRNYSTDPSDLNQTRFYNSNLGNGSVPAQSTLGAPNTNFVFPSRWVDHSSVDGGASNAPLVVRNGSMESIGELGNITDPARPFITSGQSPTRARGGGRTLRVGQPEYSNTSSVTWYYGNQTVASRTWTCWRLADVFSVSTNTNVAIPGQINPNGALRDSGAALRAALFGLTFLPGGPDGAANLAGLQAKVSNIVTNVVGRLTNPGLSGMTNALNPFWERGEISELGVLNSAAISMLAPGVAMSSVIDRGREELVRRSIEMITTRGSIFTVYVIGQSLQITSTATNVLGTSRLRSTFELTPQFVSPAATNDAFDPASVVEVNQRFSPPTNYTTQVISSSFE